ncbi:MAG: class I tRNA ligase family protein [Salinarimonas sp.]|nr:class I tRNA ligase family protein [Salinarimonas sp.]
MKKIAMFSGSTPIYNLTCTPVDLPGTSADLLGCRLAPQESSEAHNHFETEIFIFVSGEGRVEMNGESLPVAAGDAVLFERFENHVIVNTSDSEPLLFHSVYWPSDETASLVDADRKSRPALVFSTPPTPNGDLHLGHLSGPYMAADILARSLRAEGRSVRHVTGRDDHQTYVMTCGMKEGRSASATADHYDALIRDTWEQFGIGLDGYIEPAATLRYAEFVRYGIGLLRDKGLIVARTEPAAMDADGRYLHEAFIKGSCPHCGESSDGNACEACGRPNTCTDLGGATATLTGKAVAIKPVERLYFRLSAMAEELAQYVKTANMPAHVAALSLDMLEDGLPDICISHPGPWGLDLAIEGFEDHKAYVWFEMAFGYLWGAANTPRASAREILSNAATVYDGKTDIVHCYGFDNAYYHTLLFPAVHMALGLVPARTHLVNELLDLDGAKFSTSRRHLIWGRDFVQAVPRDYARFALMLNRPEALRENFVVDAVRSDLNRLFSGKLNAWAERFSSRMATRDGQLPDPGAWLADHRQFHGWLMTQVDILDASEAMESFSPRRIAQVIAAVIAEADRFSAAQSYLLDGMRSGSANYARTALALEALALAVLARACRAIMPELSCALSAPLGLDGHDGRNFLSGGHKLNGALKLNLPPVAADLAERLRPAAAAKSQAA